MTRRALLDTSALIGAVDTDSVRSLPFDALFVSALTHAELRLGFVTAKDIVTLRHRMRRMEDISRRFGEGLPFDDRCAREYERIVQLAVDSGQRPRANTMDRMIAAVAVASDMPLVTSNAADLRGLRGVVDVVELPLPSQRTND